MRRRLRLKARSKLEIEERDGGLFLRPSDALPAFEPIDYPPLGALKPGPRDYALDKLFGEESVPDDL